MVRRLLNLEYEDDGTPIPGSFRFQQLKHKTVRNRIEFDPPPLGYKFQYVKHMGRGVHSSAFRLNVSALCGIGCAFMGSLGVLRGGAGGIRLCPGCILCQKRLRLS